MMPRFQKPQRPFPKDFLWGASTASHQVEGGTHNQWSVWELAHANELALTAEERLGWLPNWQDVAPLATDPDNYVSGKAVDHYNRYEEDFELIRKMQLNAFRFGLEWSRLEPAEGKWDEAAVQHYHEYIDALHERGIEPVMTIWHWTMPVWFTDRGGFEKKENLPAFAAFVAKVAEEFGDKVKHVITLNEPNVYASFSYLSGEWPPQIKSNRTFLRVYRNLMQAHRQAYDILKARNSTLQVGVAQQLGDMQAKRPHNLFDNIGVKTIRWAWNWWFLNASKHHQDFVGINYYFTDYYKALSFGKTDAPKQANDVDVPLMKRLNPATPMNDLGWYMEPEGLYRILVRTWVHYKKPLLITENGLADADDEHRQWWLEQSVIAMERAMSEGVDVKGYLHWSLLDNFEWAFGWWPKFGLIEVDRENGMKRRPRPSAVWFARYVRDLRNQEQPEAKPWKPLPKTAKAGKLADKTAKPERKVEPEKIITPQAPKPAQPPVRPKRPAATASGKMVHPLMQDSDEEQEPVRRPAKTVVKPDANLESKGTAGAARQRMSELTKPAQKAYQSAARRIRPRRVQ